MLYQRATTIIQKYAFLGLLVVLCNGKAVMFLTQINRADGNKETSKRPKALCIAKDASGALLLHESVTRLR